MRRSVLALAGALLAAWLVLGLTPAAAARHDVGKRPPGAFDDYVLALTWVPGFCATHSDPAECGHDLTFALHGLWPQFENGDYPSACSQVALTPDVEAEFTVIYPSPTMIRHEWGKHGTCSALDPAAYFQLSDQDARKVVIPAAYRTPVPLKAKDAKAVEAAFVEANPDLPPTGVIAVVAGKRVTEVRICLTKAGAFRACRPQQPGPP